MSSSFPVGLVLAKGVKYINIKDLKIKWVYILYSRKRKRFLELGY